MLSKVEFANINQLHCEISQPLVLDTNWEISKLVTGYE